MPSSTKKRPPLEMEPGKGKAHEMKESAAEEVREGSEPDDTKAKAPSRKRSAKGAKNTKAPMDSDCGCGGKAKGKCDGNCGGYAKKMDRNDALTPQEYLAACELGIQGRSRTYIRARLDATERIDLKCGNGAISEGEKCTKGTATKAEKKEPTFIHRLQSGWSAIGAVGSGIAAAQNIGLAIEHRSLGHAVGALGNIGGAALGAKAASEFNKGRGTSGTLYGLGGVASNIAGNVAGNAIAESDFRKRQSNYVVNKPYEGPDPYTSLGLNKNASMREARAAFMKVAAEHHPDKGGDVNKFMAAKAAYEELVRRNKGRRDSVWASGFEP